MKKLITISLLSLFLTGFFAKSDFGKPIKWRQTEISVYFCNKMKKIKIHKLRRPFKKWQQRLKTPH